MTFDWCCFISYRLGKGKLAVGIVEDFREKLANELELQVDEGVYLSQGELKPGDMVDPALERALCRSACMIVLFTGKFFSKTHPFCSREYLAMRQLEASRLARLEASVGKEHGLIIPVVLRDPEELPAELEKRVWCNLTGFQQDEGGIAKPKEYFDEIRKLGAYIAARCRELSRLPDDDHRCADFRFPDDKQAQRFVAKLIEAKGKRPGR